MSIGDAREDHRSEDNGEAASTRATCHGHPVGKYCDGTCTTDLVHKLRVINHIGLLMFRAEHGYSAPTRDDQGNETT